MRAAKLAKTGIFAGGGFGRSCCVEETAGWSFQARGTEIHVDKFDCRLKYEISPIIREFCRPVMSLAPKLPEFGRMGALEKRGRTRNPQHTAN